MSWKKYKGYYVYTYYRDGVPYYVGMGTNNRMIAHHLYVDVPSFDDIIVVDDLTQQEAWDKEILLIEQYGRKCDNTGILENLTKGGANQHSGWNHSEQAKKKISKGNKGKKRTEEQKANYRKPKTKEHAEKIRQANLGRKPDGRHIKIAETMRRKRWYNNDKVTRMFEPGQELQGFVRGRTIKENQ